MPDTSDPAAGLRNSQWKSLTAAWQYQAEMPNSSDSAAGARFGRVDFTVVAAMRAGRAAAIRRC
eukprot:971232-Heterocapsa_arctica.AAC.1